jgi:hypothetical protein
VAYDGTTPPVTFCDVANGVTYAITTAATGSTGVLTEYATYQPELWLPTRIVYTSTSSILDADEGSVAIDYFNVHYVEDCWNLSIVLGAGFSDVDYRVHANSA